MIRKFIYKERGEGRAKDRALRDTSWRESRRRVMVGNKSDMGVIEKIRLKSGNSGSRKAEVREFG